MPQVPDEGRLDAKTLFQLPCNRFDQSTFARECRKGLFGQRGIFLVNATHRSVKIYLSLVPQFLLQRLGAIALIAQNPAHAVGCNQRLGIPDIMFVGRSQNEMANDPDVVNLQV